MATLLNCLECGKLVSSQAFQCQHCKTRYPSGVKCIVCCNILKRSEALKISKEYGGAENRVSVKFFHNSCHNQVNQIRTGRSRTSCPVCQYSIEFDTSSYVTCHNCGHDFPTQLENPSFASCYYCGFSLNKRLEVEVKEVSRPFLEGWITETLYAHRICYTTERQEEEKRLLLKERLEKRQINKKLTERINQKQSSRHKETLGLSILLGLVVGIIVGGLGGGISHFLLGFASSWKSAALLGFCGVSIMTVVIVWILSLFE